MKHLSPTELRATGFLQEANRQFFHPHGLALGVQYDDMKEDDAGVLVVIDFRDDPEGVVYPWTNLPKKERLTIRQKASNVFRQWKKLRNARRTLLGEDTTVQPLPNP